MNLINWTQQYETEKARLIDALGRVTDGGIVAASQHIGATSVPGLSGSPCVDIALAVWPFPLEENRRSRLEALGYRLLEEYNGSSQQRFRHESGSFQLFIVEPGMDEWMDLVLVSDYLRHSEQSCEEVSRRKADASVGKSALFDGLLPDANQWWIGHYGFSPANSVAEELSNASFEWYVSGGWALDLFLGRVERVHHDVDVIVPRHSQLDLQKYMTEHGWKLITPFEKRHEPWPLHMRLELPRHQVHAYHGEQFIDFLLTDMDGVWRYRREPLVLRSREKMSLRSAGNIPYLAPELVLLFKSKNTSDHDRAKDQPDFEKTFSYLEPERRAWLYWALMATSPDHPWIKDLVTL
jgi:GrpB-like predicted nucleotidyltransferase (UPF0157 family)